MDSDTLADFRRQLYACFVRAGDALMNAADALLTQTAAQSFVELSLSPCFERRWPSLYEAFEDAIIDPDALLGLFAAFVPPVQAGHDHALALCVLGMRGGSGSACTVVPVVVVGGGGGEIGQRHPSARRFR